MMLTAIFNYINYRFLHMPTTIGVMFISLALSLCQVLFNWMGMDVGQEEVKNILQS